MSIFWFCEVSDFRWRSWTDFQHDLRLCQPFKAGLRPAVTRQPSTLRTLLKEVHLTWTKKVGGLPSASNIEAKCLGQLSLVFSKLKCWLWCQISFCSSVLIDRTRPLKVWFTEFHSTKLFSSHFYWKGFWSFQFPYGTSSWNDLYSYWSYWYK